MATSFVTPLMRRAAGIIVALWLLASVWTVWQHGWLSWLWGFATQGLPPLLIALGLWWATHRDHKETPQ